MYHQSALKIPQNFTVTNRITRNQHPLHFIIPGTNTNAYKYSYFPRTIREWNSLPDSTIEASSLDQFLNKLTIYT